MLRAVSLGLILFVAACSSSERSETPEAALPPLTDAAARVEPRNPQTCVDEYDATVDYFPDKVAPAYAERFTVEYHRSYKLVTVTLLDGETSRYILVQCGTPPPEGPAGAQVVEIPVETVVTTSTAELPHLAELGLVDRLVGHDELDYVSTPEVRRRIAAGKVVEVGHETRLNLEILLDVAPDLVLAATFGPVERDVFDQVRQGGSAVVWVPSFLERRPLGQAEWILFTSLFFNREARAAQVFDAVAGRYTALAERARSVASRPTVFTGAPIGDVWHVPGGESFLARLVADAGGRYLWADEDVAGTLPLAVESVYERAVTADFWLQPGLWSSLEEIAGADERFVTLPAFSNRRIYANDVRMNDLGRQGIGGNDYWESGMLRADLVLADFMKILHPELVPEHHLVYHRRL